LFIRQTEAFPSKLLLEYSVFFAEVVDGLGLLSVDPASERREEDFEVD
jgi:hypothetical protein